MYKVYRLPWCCVTCRFLCNGKHSGSKTRGMKAWHSNWIAMYIRWRMWHYLSSKQRWRMQKLIILEIQFLMIIIKRVNRRYCIPKSLFQRNIQKMLWNRGAFWVVKRFLLLRFLVDRRSVSWQIWYSTCIQRLWRGRWIKSTRVHDDWIVTVSWLEISKQVFESPM